MRTNLKVERMLHKIIILGLASISIIGCSTLSPQNAEMTSEGFTPLVRIDPIPETQQLISKEKFAEADGYLTYFMDFDYVKEDPEAIRLQKFIQDTRDDWLYKIKKFNKGLIDGESDEPAGEVAAVISDFTGLGDLRDLGVEGKKFIQGQEVNKVNLALASFGTGALAASIVTAGASTTTKPALSFLKMTNKAGKMPEWLGKFLIGSASNPANAKNTEQLSSLLSSLHGLYKTAGARTTLELLAKSESHQDFQRLARFGKSFGNRTPTLVKLAGNDAISIFQCHPDIPKKLYLEASSFGPDGLKALEKSGNAKFQTFLNAENTARRRMTNFEMNLASSGTKAIVLGNDFVKRDYLFNPKFIDGTGRSNIERMKFGMAPIGKDGNPINLHHMKQQMNGLLVEMSATEHREYSELLHRYSRVSEIKRDDFDLLRSAYWKMRAKDFE